MHLLTDAHVKRAYVTALRSDGHTVERVVDVETLGQTAADEEILADAVGRIERLVGGPKDLVLYATSWV